MWWVGMGIVCGGGSERAGLMSWASWSQAAMVHRVLHRLTVPLRR